MNAEIVAQIIAGALHERPEFANVPIWEPTDEEKDGDTALLVNVTGADEIIPGNYTYKISGESCTGSGPRKRIRPAWFWT